MAHKLKSKYALIFSVALVLLVSGCTSSGGGSTGASRTLAVEVFEPDISGIDIQPGETVKFSLFVRNTGTERAKTITGTISGLDGWTLAAIGTTCPISTNIITLGDLNPPNPEFNTPGQLKQCTFSATAPSSPLTQTFQPKVTLNYNYNSATITRVKLVGREKFIIKRDAGEQVDAETTFKSTSPIDIGLTAGGQGGQIRVVGTTVTFPLTISATNVDNGYVSTSIGGTPTLKQVSIILTAPDLTLKSPCDVALPMDLFKGQRGEVVCDIEGAISTGTEEKLVSVTATSDYLYTAEHSGPSIKVKRA